MATALIQCSLGEWECSTGFANGTKYTVKFEAKNDCIAEVPDLLQYKNEFGKVIVHDTNYAQHLLNSYPFLKLVKVIEKKAIEAPPIVAPKGQAVAEPSPEPVKKPGRPSKKQEEGVSQ